MGELRRRDGFISGRGLSDTLLGYSDVGLMGFELNLAAVTRLAACCTVPLLADADTGYGNAVNVYHTTQAFEQVGVAGLMIEDQTWPKRRGHMQGKEVIPAEERGLERRGLGAQLLRYIIPHLGLRCRLSRRQVRRAP
jgi:2-methylisocitrate lyase-like PEP mutase family enzyme